EARERRENLRNAFRVVDELPQHRRVGLVDDVITTAATLNACALALRAGGVRTVWGLALASPFRT
ncbi:MAG: ComF family protein, partial [Dehalococcoidia bacterium]|nr:ComF family protein [Dehalococcoidia bacterium]